MNHEDYRIKLGRRYNKLFKVTQNGSFVAEAFYDTQTKLWFNAASWNKPSRRLYAGYVPKDILIVK